MTPIRMSVPVSNPARLPRLEPPCHIPSKNGSFWTRIHPQQTTANPARTRSPARAAGWFFRFGWTGTLRKQMTSPSRAKTASWG